MVGPYRGHDGLVEPSLSHTPLTCPDHSNRVVYISMTPSLGLVFPPSCSKSSRQSLDPQRKLPLLRGGWRVRGRGPVCQSDRDALFTRQNKSMKLGSKHCPTLLKNVCSTAWASNLSRINNVSTCSVKVRSYNNLPHIRSIYILKFCTARLSSVLESAKSLSTDPAGY